MVHISQPFQYHDTIGQPSSADKFPKNTITQTQLDLLIHTIRTTPIVDHHAHPLLNWDNQTGKYPLLHITSEASGDAIESATTSLAHLRAVRQLSTELKCAPNWESVVAKLEAVRLDPDEPDIWGDWISRCLEGVHTILLDDGLDNKEAVEDLDWHTSYVQSPCRRILRIEAIASDLIKHLSAGEFHDVQKAEAIIKDPAALKEFWENWAGSFDNAIKNAIDDPLVVGFKSVVAYRTGLDVAGKEPSGDAVRPALKEVVKKYLKVRTARLEDSSLNDYVIHRTATLIRDYMGKNHEEDIIRKPRKPIQFHTGLGDSDLTLAKASPSHLQEFIRSYPDVPMVLLHAGYPFTKEIAYMATVYKNVYADIGEVFPCISKDGQERVLMEILELCPWSKILWSTDGHWFPETYLLAIMQMREAFENVLCSYVLKGQIGWRAAIVLVQDLLFKNANKLYHLGLDFPKPEEVASRSLARYPNPSRNLTLLRELLNNTIEPTFVQICWNDYTALQRMRLVPFRKFMTLLEAGRSLDIGITKAVFGMIQNDHLIPGSSATGEYRLHPDFSSLKHGPVAGHISMHGEFREQDGFPVALCPRSLLLRSVEIGSQKGLGFLLGFEIEFLLLERVEDDSVVDRYTALKTDGHAWSVSKYYANPKINALLKNMVETLAQMDIYVEQIHAESATGQFELILPPYPPVQAVDTLLHTRDVMANLATEAGFKMTLHPKPFAKACGTAAHMHMSILPEADAFDAEKVTRHFYAGVLKHLRAITAFSYSNAASYDRAQDGVWAGGRWVAWGTQNRETALRKIEGSHWEVKIIDGLANPYFVASAILLAGIRGVETEEKMVWDDCEMDPAKLSDMDRKELGISQMLPASVEEALRALQEDTEMVEMLGDELVERYVAIKEFEDEFLGKMGAEVRRLWLMERY
ncbi:hypothetical protein QC761_209890 [Podospora bellae-mahoneyi]|uniref:Glutamine synthetase n=1 Tax=Podospora bellae-mahoneyi TaxID=2093777 RepID=A0ABR0FTU1_9PEZI|nr:hypothetical protein QC761_209890 [Podospora bellae-mahoneyi]